MDTKKEIEISNICCIGAGFVGGPTMSVIALKCPEIRVNVVDSDKEKIKRWNGRVKNLPVFEPGLSEIVSKVRNKNLFFTTDIKNSIKDAQIIFIAVNTPTKSKGEGAGMAADLKFVKKSAELIAKFSNSDKIVVEKSTLPVRTAEKLKEILNNKNSAFEFEILSNPEFLAEGTAINDLFKSDRVLIGSEQTKSGIRALNTLTSIYLRWIPKNKIYKTNVWSSELAKLASNAFLAQRISSINSLSPLCESTGANILEISKAVGLDARIGPMFLQPSPGFGGSCFKKDILNLVYLFRYYGHHESAEYWNGVLKINEYQIERISKKIVEDLKFKNSRKVTIFGWAFKKNTNDSRESQSIYLAINLLKQGFKVSAYDPMIKSRIMKQDISKHLSGEGLNRNQMNFLLKNFESQSDYVDAVHESSAICIMTEWDEFLKLNWSKIYYKCKKPIKIYDTRLLIEKNTIKKIGFKLYQIGI